MTSPAQAHAMRIAALLQADRGDTDLANATGYELMLAKLHADRRRLKQIESTTQKIAVKRELLPEYIPWVEGALQGNGAQDDVLMTILVWRIDAGDWQGALDIAAYALRFNLSLPDQFGRNLPCLIAEEFADQAARGEPVPVAMLTATDALLADRDMPDQVRAKLAKAIGYALIRCADTLPPDASAGLKQQALAHFQRAVKLHDKVGVKKDLERLERELKNLAPVADNPATEG